jgi:hypothetical protein
MLTTIITTTITFDLAITIAVTITTTIARLLSTQNIITKIGVLIYNQHLSKVQVAAFHTFLRYKRCANHDGRY